MKREVGKVGILVGAIVGALLIGTAGYFAFFKSSGYTAEDQALNDAQTKVSDQNMRRTTESMQRTSPQGDAPRDGRQPQ